ncbi:MAG: hypothetical protein KatS3mg087_1248 [Patescibacteria group bacterium]|nr:MAG: hypothetical protein KatS3mg087_1248 [Patescibacteria group bacterium]
MRKTIDKLSSRYSQGCKGAIVRKMGFETSIHALPYEIKKEIDEMIGWKYSPISILRQLSQKYPDRTLPSKSALYNYRKRYFTDSLTSIRQVTHDQVEVDLDKLRLKLVLVDQIKRFIALDLPTIREKWLLALENDQHLQLSSTSELAKLYLNAVKLGLDTIPKLNINVENELDQVDGIQESKLDEEWVDNALLELVENHGAQIKVRVQGRRAARERLKAQNLAQV